MIRPSRLVELSPDDPVWCDLVERTPGATVFHHPAWTRAVSGAYGYRTTALAVVDAGGRALTGLPLARVRRLGGAAWVSLPFTDHCEPLACDEAARRRLAEGLARWGGERGVRVEVRGPMPGEGWATGAAGVRHVLALDGPLEGVRSRLSATHRRRLRQAERAGLHTHVGGSAADVEAFYRLHVQTRRRQGVPVQPRRFFASVHEHVIEPRLGAIALVRTGAGVPVAGAVLLAWNGSAIVKFQASDAAAWNLRPNHLVYWAAIGWAAANGCRTFDFGRSDPGDAGLQRWKASWGGAAVPLAYAVAGGGRPVTGERGRIGALLGEVIRRSPPAVCRAVGGLLYRYAA